jgi:iron complex outermembrane recepter protein
MRRVVTARPGGGEWPGNNNLNDKQKLAAVAVFLCGCGAASAARAQEVIQLPQIEVTATGEKTPLSQSPATVTVVGGDQIQAQPGGRLGDALITVPGLYLSGNAVDGVAPIGASGQINLNGVAGPNRTIILIDGIPFNSPLGTSVDYSQLPTFGVDRIEVLPGPYSALYGSQALGGVINIVTKEPTKREFESDVSLGYGTSAGGSFGTDKVNLAYRDVISPGLGVAFDLSYSGSTGYHDTPATAFANPFYFGPAPTPVTGAIAIPGSPGSYVVGDTGSTPWYQLKSGVRLYYDLDADTKFTLGVGYSESYLEYGEGPNSYLVDGAGQKIYNGAGQLPNGDILQLTAQPGNLITNPFLGFLPGGEQIFRAYGTAQTKIDDISIKNTLSYMFDRSWYDQSAPLTSVVVDPAAQPVVPGSLISNPSYRVLYNLQAEKPLTTWDALTVGFQTEHDQIVSEQQDISDYIVPSSLTGATSNYGTGWTTTYSLFFQNRMDFFNNKVHLYVGGREDWWSTEGNMWSTVTPNTPTNVISSVVNPSESVSSFSPKASLVYNVTDELTLRTSAGRGFRTPDLFTLYSSNPFFPPAPNLKPETDNSWEAAAEWKPTTGTKIAARYYENYLANFLDYNCSFGVIGLVCTAENAAKATSRGLSLAIEHQLTDEWSIFANATRTWSRMEADLVNPAADGMQLTFTPNFMANAGVKYVNGPWSGMISVRYSSKVFSNETDADRADGMFTFYDPYVLVDAKLSYKLDENATVSLIGKNLGNVTYYEYYLQPGRTMLASFSYKF